MRARTALDRATNSLAERLACLVPRVVKLVRFRGYGGEGFHPDREPELAIVPFLLPPSSTFIDVGANRGEYGYVVERHRPDVSIVAFEPIPELARVLACLFPKARVESRALSDRATVAAFKVPVLAGREMKTRGSLETGYTEPGEEGMRTLEVQVTTLDQWCCENDHAPIGLVKIDVEGHEWATLAGATDTIAKERPVLLVEIESRHHAGGPIWPLMDAFAKRVGARVFAVDSLARTFTEVLGPDAIRQDMRDHKSRAYINNFFFLPVERVDALRAEVERRLAVRA